MTGQKYPSKGAKKARKTKTKIKEYYGTCTLCGATVNQVNIAQYVKYNRIYCDQHWSAYK